jgi:hypothetical protein
MRYIILCGHTNRYPFQRCERRQNPNEPERRAKTGLLENAPDPECMFLPLSLGLIPQLVSSTKAPTIVKPGNDEAGTCGICLSTTYHQ